MRLHFEDGERELVAARLNLPADADDATIGEAMANWVSTDPPAREENNDDDTNASNDITDVEADEGDVVIVDVSEFRRLRQRDRVAAEVEETARRRDRDELIEEAIADGKFGPGRRDHYKARYDSDPEGTATLLGRLTKNTVPLEARGVDVPTDEVDETSYPTDWVPEVAARQSRPASRVMGED